jgi:hypothetical protein
MWFDVHHETLSFHAVDTFYQKPIRPVSCLELHQIARGTRLLLQELIRFSMPRCQGPVASMLTGNRTSQACFKPFSCVVVRGRPISWPTVGDSNTIVQKSNTKLVSKRDVDCPSQSRSLARLWGKADRNLTLHSSTVRMTMSMQASSLPSLSDVSSLHTL